MSESTADKDAERTSSFALIAAQHAADDLLTKAYHDNIAAVAIASIDRSRDSAKFVQVAATAILGVYTGLLGLVFSVTSNPLPVRGVWAGVFLGLSIALATAYLAYNKQPPTPHLDIPDTSMVQRQYARTAYFTRWVAAVVNNRRHAIRSSVLALGAGVAFMVAPFIGSTSAPAIPDSPTPPTIPAAIAAPLSSDAQKLFAQQVTDYTNAVAARAEALKQSRSFAAKRSERENNLNWTAAGLAILAGFLIGFIPFAFAETPDTGAVPATS